MKEIRYTLGNSPLWHSLYLDFDLSDNEIHDDTMLANLITEELRRTGIQESAKRVKVLDERNNEIAHSDDISEVNKLKFGSDETEQS